MKVNQQLGFLDPLYPPSRKIPGLRRDIDAPVCDYWNRTEKITKVVILYVICIRFREFKKKITKVVILYVICIRFREFTSQ